MSSQQDDLKETDTEARFEFKKEEKSAFKTDKGLTEETVRVISEDKGEPEWMLERRLRALKQFQEMPMPTDWPGQPDLSEVDIDEIIPYIRPDVDVRSDVRDDLVDVDFAQVRLAGPVGRHRHLLELLERAQAALQHPLGFALVLGDDADRLLGEALLGLEGGLLLLLELEAGLGVCLFEVVLL